MDWLKSDFHNFRGVCRDESIRDAMELAYRTANSSFCPESIYSYTWRPKGGRYIQYIEQREIEAPMEVKAFLLCLLLS